MLLSWMPTMRLSSRARAMGALIAGSLALLAAMSFGAAGASALTTERNCALPGSDFQGGDGNQATPTLTEQAFCLGEGLSTTRDWQNIASSVTNSPDPNAKDSEFEGGNKETEPNKWGIKFATGPVSPPKTNILSGWSLAEPKEAETFLYLAFERESTTGDTFLTFELNQVKGLWENENKAMIPCRTTGDVLIAYNVPGKPPVGVVLYRWVTDEFKETATTEDATLHKCAKTGHFEPSEGTAVKSPNEQGEMNFTEEIKNYLKTEGTTPENFQLGSFGEAALNLTHIFENANLGPCFAFGQMWMSSRSSESIDSQLQDYVSPVGILANSCSISGRKFDDVNGSKEDLPSKPGLSGWTIQLLDSKEKVLAETKTDSEGNYTFTDVGPGSYIVREVSQTGWTCDYPGTGTSCQHSVTISSSNINSTGNDFGNKPTSEVLTTQEPKSGVVGTKFGDSATVKGPATGGAPTPTGEVEFTLYSEEGCKKAVAGPFKETLSSGKASIPEGSKVQLSTAGTYYWVANYLGDSFNSPAESECDAEPVIVNPPIEVEKKADAASVSAGTNIGFTVTIRNPGATTATGVELKDPLPAGNTGHAVTWSIDTKTGNPASFEITGTAGSQELVLMGQPVSLAAKTSLSVHVTAATDATSCATYNNAAEVTTSNDGSGEAKASEEVKCAHIEVEKTADAASVSAGTNIGFTVTIKNSGAGTATGVELSDKLPGGNSGSPVSWSISPANSSFEIKGTAGSQELVLKGQPVSLAPGASLSVHVTAETSSTSCATYNNTAEVTTSNDGSAEASAEEKVLCAKIEVEKTADASSVSSGEAIGFTVTITNKGAGEATGVKLSDKLPAGNSGTPVTWSIDTKTGNPASFEITGSAGSQSLILKGQPVSLAAGASLSVHITASTGSANCATYNNTAEVTTSNDGSAEASAEEKVLCAKIEVEKTADASSVSSGEAIGFTVTITNKGAGEATGVKLSDKLPAGNSGTPVTWSIDTKTGNPTSFEITGTAGSQSLILKGQPVSLAAGASLSVHITASTGSANCATYNNTAEVTTGNDGSGEASASEEVLCPEIEVKKTADAASVSSGSPIGFTVTITNKGAGEATGVKLSDKLPAGNSGTPVTWSIDTKTGDPASFEITGSAGSQSLILKGQPVSLASKASLSVHITAPTGATNCAAYNNTAEVTTSNDGSGKSSASEEVLCPEIEVKKTADATSVSSGSSIGFTVTITNKGEGEAHGVELKDALPAGNAGHAVTWSIDGSKGNLTSFEITGAAGSQSLILKGQPVSLAAGASLTVHVTAPTGATNCAAYNNTAEVTTSNDGSGKSSASEEVLCPEIEVKKTADAASVSSGTNIGFTVTIKNNGEGTAAGVTLTDALPGGNSGHPVSWSIDGATGNPALFEITGVAGSQALVLKGQPDVSLAPGSSVSVHVTAPTDTSSCTTYNNTAQATTSNDGSGEASAKEAVLCPGIAVVKEQQVAGSGKPFTTATLEAKAGEQINYRITVTNTGEVPLALSFSDPHCDPGTITGPTGNLNSDGTLAPGGVAQYFCSHVMQTGDAPQLTNAATVTGQPPSGPPVSGTSSVVVNVAKAVVAPQCTLSLSSIVLHGAGGSRRKPFTVSISSLGIQQITFYLDKHKLKTLTQKQAKNGKYTIKIDPRKLRFGAHTVSIKTVMTDAACANIARAGVFVHPRPPVVKPKFTG